MPDNTRSPGVPARATAKAAIGGGLAGAAALALSLAVASLKTDEGKRSAAYLDIARVPTVCYGHTGADVGRIGAARSDAQCDAMLTSDARATMTAVLACAPLADRPEQLAASTRLAFNIGAGAFCGSGTASAFRRGDWRKGCDLMLAWDKARVGGQLLSIAGLTARRQRERAQCLMGLAA